MIPVDAVVTGPRLEARSGVLESLGVPIVEHPMGVGSHVEVNRSGRGNLGARSMGRRERRRI